MKAREEGEVLGAWEQGGSLEPTSQSWIIIIREMALLLELESQPLSVTETPGLPPHRALIAGFSALVRQLEAIEVLHGLQPCGDGQRLQGRFWQQLPLGLGVLYRLEVEAGARVARAEAAVMLGGRQMRVKSSEMLRNVCRTMRWVNGLASRAVPLVAVGPETGEVRVALQIEIGYNCAQTIFTHLRACIAQTSAFLRSFAPVLLHAANLAPRSVLSALPPALKPLFFGPGGDLARLAEVFQLLPCVNCPLEAEESGERDKNSNPKRIIELYYDQWEMSQNRETDLYAEPVVFRPDQQVVSFEKTALGLGFPMPKEAPHDHPCIFNTITVTNYLKEGERFVAEGGRAKIIASPSRFFYSKSFNPLSESAGRKDKSERSTADTEEAEGEGVEGEGVEGEGVGQELYKMLLVKMPRVGPKEKDWRRLLEHIRYEKAVLCNLRTVGCAYLPKYYHSVQKGYEYRPFLLMDYVPGNTLIDEMDLRSATASLSFKLNILSHLSNALRFLEQREIVHLDLTPSNVIVARDLLVKLVDFGEAYHKATSGRFAYSPGRTFPYAPPETSLRLGAFTSQQDMYSLGVILQQLVFGALPFTCQQETHKRLYREGGWQERLLLAPERAEDYGQADVMAVLMSLAGKLMDGEGRRPHPVWAHLIVKKLFYTLR